MRKKVFLDTKEYDIFIFPVPESVLKGKKLFVTLFPQKSMKDWVVSWMQRLHPCFDGRFLHDIRFYKEKERVMALVTVAEKMNVAHHLAKERSAVFVSRPYKRRVFAGNVPAHRFWLASALVAALVMTMLSGFVLYSEGRMPEVADFAYESDVPDIQVTSCLFDAPNTTEISEIDDIQDATQAMDIADISETVQNAVIQQNVVTKTVVKSVASEENHSESINLPSIYDAPSIYNSPFIDEFISALTEGGCRISSFRWQTEPFVSVVMSVEGCFPEDIYACAEKLCGDLDSPENENLPRLSFSSIRYTDNVPSFSVVLDYSRFETKSEKDIRKAAVRSAQAVFRNLIVRTGGSVIAESIEPQRVTGIIPGKSWNAFSKEVSRIFETEDVGGIASVDFSTGYDASAGESSVSVDMSFSSSQTSFFPLEDVAVLFPSVKSVQAQNPLELAVTEPDEPFVSMYQIGSVCMGGNVYVKFYRDYDGKIFKGEPYEKE